MEEPKKMDLRSIDITAEHKAKLKQIFPHVFNEDKIDFERLKQTLGEDVDAGLERFGLTWPGKAECMKIIQQPSIGTLKPLREESVNFDTTENLFIEGDNLEVLKLLQKSYYGKVKMIYIDPPYNTGKEFIYPDKYSESLGTYLAYTGQVDAEGKKFSTNTEADGRFHSKWINMMYPRLFLARNLLRDDGVIFISIDDNEVSNLRKLLDEIFGEENFVAQIEWQKRYTRSNNTDNFTTVVEHICVYRKSDGFNVKLLERNEEANARFENPDNDPRGPWKATPFLNQVPPEKRPNLCYPITNPYTGHTESPTKKAWRYEKGKYEELLKDNRLWWGVSKDRKVPDIKTFLSEVRQGMTPINFWNYEFAGHTDLANNEIKDLFGIKVFDTPKPCLLIKRIIEHACSNGDLILDFFAGSCPTAQAVLEMNSDSKDLSFIVCQLPEVLPSESQAYEMGLKDIADIGKERIRRVIKKIQDESKDQLDFQNNKTDLGFKVFKLDQSNFKIWDSVIDQASGGKKIEKQLELQIEHINPNATEEEILYELLLKSGFALTTKVETLQMTGKRVYSVENGALLICLEKNLSKEVITEMARKEPARVICLDSGFSGNDQLKTNAVQIMKSHKVEDFRTV